MTLEQTLRNLVAHWRKKAKNDCPSLLVEMAFIICANELDAALTAMAPTTMRATPEGVQAAILHYNEAATDSRINLADAYDALESAIAAHVAARVVDGVKRQETRVEHLRT